MKKSFIIFNLILMTFMISGCGCSKDKKEVTCKKNIEFDTYNYYAEYIIKYDSNGKLIDYTRNEKMESDDENLLQHALEYKNYIYSGLNEIEGYTFEGNIDDKKLLTKLNIDFLNIDTDELLEIGLEYEPYYNEEKKQFNITETLNDLKENDFECTE